MVVSTEPGLYYATLNLTMPVGHGKRAEQCFLFFANSNTIYISIGLEVWVEKWPFMLTNRK